MQVCSVNSEPSQSSSPLRTYQRATVQLRSSLHKSEVLLIVSILLVVKAENIYRNTNKMHKTMETELSH